MAIDKFPLIVKLIVLIIFLQLFHSCECVEFDRRYTGVVYSAYVKRSEGGKPIPDWNTYSLGDVKTMLEVVSGRFFKIATYGVGAENVEYKQNETYYTSNGQVHAAEAAALINKEKNEAFLTVIIGIWQSDEPKQMKNEIMVAFESAQKANEIYPGTALGLVFTQDDIGSSTNRANQTLKEMKRYKADAINSGLKIGSRQRCYNITNRETPLAEIRRNILKESDFIICQVKPSIDQVRLGAESAFRTVRNDLINFRPEFKEVNPNIEVMGQSGWSSKGPGDWENINNLQKYWEVVNNFSSKNSFTMWMDEAFDIPWKGSDGNYGWWKLRENSKVGLKEGYAEKIYEPPEDDPLTALSSWVYMGISIGGLIIFLIFAVIALLFFRVKKLQEALTKDDVREFMYGVSDENAAAQQVGGQAVVESALKFPYDKSYEISRDKLKINREALLGTGQFGFVYKAKVENEESTEVAVKMAKSDCPKLALKGLLSEIKILTYLGKHPNIVSIIGACTGEMVKGIIYVATELCILGSLESYLRKGDRPASINVNNDRYINFEVFRRPESTQEETQLIAKPKITFMDMVRWSHEIACGMEYLGTKHVVHADLATRNVLLASDKTAKITDFGLSRRLYDYTNYVKKQQEPLPWRWMAIESLRKLEFSSKSDVWSYGVTLWEIFAMADIPYPGLSWNLEFVDNLVNGMRMKSPPHASPEIFKIMVDCWRMEPNERPTFTDLKLSTGNIMEMGTCIEQTYSMENQVAVLEETAN